MRDILSTSHCSSCSQPSSERSLMPMASLNLANIRFISSGIAHNDRSLLNLFRKCGPSIVVTRDDTTQDQLEWQAHSLTNNSCATQPCNLCPVMHELLIKPNRNPVIFTIVKDRNQQHSFSLSWWKQRLEVEPRQFARKDCHSAP